MIDIIYQLQLKQNELTAEVEYLSDQLEDKRLRISNAGSIAQAAMDIHSVMQSAQDAADVYLEEVRHMREETEAQCNELLENARQDAEAAVAQARQEAEAIIAKALKDRNNSNPRSKGSGKKKHKKKKK